MVENIDCLPKNTECFPLAVVIMTTDNGNHLMLSGWRPMFYRYPSWRPLLEDIRCFPEGIRFFRSYPILSYLYRFSTRFTEPNYKCICYFKGQSLSAW